MKFLALLAIFVATVIAVAIPAQKESCPADDSFDWLALLKDFQDKGTSISPFQSTYSSRSLYSLLPTGEIKISGPPDSFDDITDDLDLTKRWDVPGLHCGSSRALRCAADAGGTVAKCAQAAMSGGADFTLDASCIRAAMDFGTQLVCISHPSWNVGIVGGGR